MRLDAGVVEFVRRPQAIFQADDGDALRIEDISGVFDMRLPIQGTVATTCANNDRHAGAFVRWRQEQRDRWHGDVANRAAFFFDLDWSILQELRRFVRPQRDDIGCQRGGRAEQENGRREMQRHASSTSCAT